MNNNPFGTKNPKEAMARAALMRRRMQAQAPMGAGKQEEDPAAYERFSASELYCPKCKQAMPVREKLLLYLTSGEVYDYVCAKCGTSVGARRTNG